MARYLLLRLQGPLQAWGDATFDKRRPVRAFPGRSALAGMLASAMGWRYSDHDGLNKLANGIRCAVVELSAGDLLHDYQTADLGAEARGERREGWASSGAEGRGGSARDGTQILDKFYISDADLLLALRVEEGVVMLDDIKKALQYPARPIFLGRKSCPPGGPVFAGEEEAETGLMAVQAFLERKKEEEEGPGKPTGRAWYDPGEGPQDNGRQAEILDQRDFESNQFTTPRWWIEGRF